MFGRVAGVALDSGFTSLAGSISPGARFVDLNQLGPGLSRAPRSIAPDAVHFAAAAGSGVTEIQGVCRYHV
jgi:hypothetical protein